MRTNISYGLMRRSGNLCLGVGLMLVGLFSWSPPILGETNANNRKIMIAQVEPKSQVRRIEIDLSKQRLYAWEGKTLVYSFRVSTGKRSTPTPTGEFFIDSKYRTNRMRGRNYDIPDVPYAMYFYRGYAIHGAYWHNSFGTPISHGCVNLPVQQARKLYNWTKLGMMVQVHK
ncbi:MAG: L,D-transpeptidase [Cyanomargarita calcarea GSE-NOS-MK-12-04C]|jgi:lipoprotein-anchoring transpeptidase ErfK/SrfK|uniref:L,D-transpeptidase n=1 Tax=Cyanomargarita calcarea GSE-NOS-MK-12-04C TaxID=2839659 RepID=A0A951UUH3_9CYAN|nr:L,D-transpeptidase [Cyanomargarita calcarea GSE-NOS-MK-12-04C]